MIKTFKEAFGVQVWFVPTLIVHIYLLFEGDIYSNGYYLLSFIICSSWIIAASVFTTSIYETIYDDVTSPIHTRHRLSSACIKIHILLFLILLLTFFAFMQSMNLL